MEVGEELIFSAAGPHTDDLFRACSHEPKCLDFEAIFSQNEAKNRRKTGVER